MPPYWISVYDRAKAPLQKFLGLSVTIGGRGACSGFYGRLPQVRDTENCKCDETKGALRTVWSKVLKHAMCFLCAFMALSAQTCKDKNKWRKVPAQVLYYRSTVKAAFIFLKYFVLRQMCLPQVHAHIGRLKQPWLDSLCRCTAIGALTEMFRLDDFFIARPRQYRSPTINYQYSSHGFWCNPCSCGPCPTA